MNRIKKALKDSGKWVRVNDDERRRLFEAFGIIRASDEFACSTLYTTDAAGELVAPVDVGAPRKDDIVPFSDIAKPTSRLAQFLGVEDGQGFTHPKLPHSTYRIMDGIRQYRTVSGGWGNCNDERTLAMMLCNPSEIHPCPVWSEEQRESAHVLKTAGFEKVSVSTEGQTYYHINGIMVPIVGNTLELQPGQTVALGEIR